MRSLRFAVRLCTVVAALGVGLAGLAAAQPTGTGHVVTVRDPGGALLARVPLAEDGVFAVSYRNSLYGTLAEERYRTGGDGRFTLVELAADQLAVLEEYYAVPGPAQPARAGDPRRWIARPAGAPEFTALSIAATALGERTLHVPGHPPVPLAPLTGGGTDPTVVLDLEEVP